MPLAFVQGIHFPAHRVNNAENVSIACALEPASDTLFMYDCEHNNEFVQNNCKVNQCNGDLLKDKLEV